MNAFDRLAAAAGQWRGTSHLQDPSVGVRDDSESTAVIQSVLGGRFLRLDYSWAYQGKPQEGSLLLGHDPKSGQLSAHWIDSWHMGNVVMRCEGSNLAEAPFSVRGSYAAPPGPDWGWRIDLEAGEDMLRMVMYNVWPEGKEELAVEAAYARAGASGGGASA
jgi:hypothetical protein